MRCRRGFTLIELVIVLAIMGILLGVAVFSVAGVALGVNKTTTADQIYSRMRMMQEFAISDGKERRATFLLNNDQVRFYAGSAESSEIRELRIVLPPGVTFENGTSLNVFFTSSGHIRTTAGTSTLLGGSARMRTAGHSDVYVIWYQTGRIRLGKTLH